MTTRKITAANTKVRHEQILAAGRAPDAADIDTFPAGLTPYRAREVAKMEQHTAAVEAITSNGAPELAAQDGQGRT